MSSPRATSELAYLAFRTAEGWMAVAGSARGICRVVLPVASRKQARQRIVNEVPSARPVGRSGPTAALLARAADRLSRHVAGKPQRLDLKVDLSSLTPFRRRVLKACRSIPPGRTVTYGALAEGAGCPGAARAVGGALAANPVPLLVPCHRVVRSDGGLGGFTAPGGVALKRQLLRLEGAAGKSG